MLATALRRSPGSGNPRELLKGRPRLARAAPAVRCGPGECEDAGLVRQARAGLARKIDDAGQMVDAARSQPLGLAVCTGDGVRTACVERAADLQLATSEVGAADAN